MQIKNRSLQSASSLRAGLASIIVASIGIGNAAMAQSGAEFDVTCSGGGDVRQILVVAPGVKGKACDVIYTRDRGATSSTPYYANADTNYCYDKAATIRNKLQKARYSCEGAGIAYRVRASAPVAPKPVTPKADVVKTIVTSEEQASVPNSPSSGPSTLSTAEPTETVVTQSAEKGSSPRDKFLKRLKEQEANETETDSDNQENQDGEQETASLQKATQSAPVTLVTPAVKDTVLVDERTANAQRPSRRDVAKKLTGATPTVLASSEPGQSLAKVPSVAAVGAKVSNTVVREQAPTRTAAAPVQKSASTLLSSVLSSAVADKPRSRPEIIRATLTAQAAAWNEGDIDAFMDGYWRDPELRFVSGTEVSKGWNATLKRYKQVYGNGAALGQLAFEEMDVQMVTEEVAIVVGRFVLVRGEARDSGLFTLVMKRFEGAWRIVHDHTVGDTPQED